MDSNTWNQTKFVAGLMKYTETLTGCPSNAEDLIDYIKKLKDELDEWNNAVDDIDTPNELQGKIEELEEETENHLASLNLYKEQCEELKQERKQLKEENKTLQEIHNGDMKIAKMLKEKWNEEQEKNKTLKQDNGEMYRVNDHLKSLVGEDIEEQAKKYKELYVKYMNSCNTIQFVRNTLTDSS